jgi:hypothetical protein
VSGLRLSRWLQGVAAKLKSALGGFPTTRKNQDFLAIALPCRRELGSGREPVEHRIAATGIRFNMEHASTDASLLAVLPCQGIAISFHDSSSVERSASRFRVRALA